MRKYYTYHQRRTIKEFVVWLKEYIQELRT